MLALSCVVYMNRPCWEPCLHQTHHCWTHHRQAPEQRSLPLDQSHVKRGLFSCLYGRARSITTRQDNLQKEECHLTKVLEQNGYLSAFICSSSLPSGCDLETIEAPPLGYIGQRRHQTGLQEVRYEGCLQVWMIPPLHTLAMEKLPKVMYRVPCSCGRAYIGEMVRRLKTRMKEHWNTCQNGVLEK